MSVLLLLLQAGGSWDDFNAGVVGISKMVVGYTRSAVVAVQASSRNRGAMVLLSIGHDDDPGTRAFVNLSSERSPLNLEPVLLGS
jgi:hypothetical protein